MPADNKQEPSADHIGATGKKRTGGPQKNAVLPASLDFADFGAEKAVLAAILSEPESLNTVFSILSLADDQSKKKDKAEKSFHHADVVFRDPKYAAIYEAMLELDDKDQGIDILSISRQLQNTNKLDIIGGIPALMEIQNSISSTANLETWCGIVKDHALLREMVRAITLSLDMCKNSQNMDVKTLLDEVESKLYNVRNSFVQPEIRELKPLIKEVFQQLMAIANKEVPPGIPTGYSEFDRMIGGGLKKGEMVVLAARPSIGKTALALNIIRNIIMRESGGSRHSVALFSLEMTAEAVGYRLLCTESRVPYTSFLDSSFRDNELPQVTKASKDLSEAKLFIDPTGGITLFELRAKARQLAQRNKIDLIVIDYLQLVQAGENIRDGRQVEVSMVSGGIKKLAKDLNIPILVLAQLNREVEKGVNPKAMPKLSHLRDSGSIEQDADVVVFLHRNRDESKEGGPEKETARNGVEAKLIVEKNRNGKTGFVDLLFYPALMEFRPKEHKYQESDVPR